MNEAAQETILDAPTTEEVEKELVEEIFGMYDDGHGGLQKITFDCQETKEKHECMIRELANERERQQLLAEIELQRKEYVAEDKNWRLDLDSVLEKIKSSKRGSANRTLALRHIEDAVFRLGMDLSELHSQQVVKN